MISPWGTPTWNRRPGSRRNWSRRPATCAPASTPTCPTPGWCRPPGPGGDAQPLHDLEFKAQDVVLTCGASGGLNVILKALLDPGDEVVILAPYFPEYLFYADNHGGVARVVETDEHFQPDLDRLPWP